jgi:hypothetical protein
MPPCTCGKQLRVDRLRSIGKCGLFDQQLPGSKKVTTTWSTLEDFPALGIPNVHSLIPDSKPYLVVKIIDI